MSDEGMMERDHTELGKEEEERGGGSGEKETKTSGDLLLSLGQQKPSGSDSLW